MKIKTLCFFIFLNAAIGFYQTLSSQNTVFNNNLSFYLLDVEQGLSNNIVNSIVQDSLGFIWIATTEGLNRYNGTQFKTYKKNDLINNTSLGDNYIEQIRLIDDGKLLLATPLGINIYNQKKEKFDIINNKNGLLGNNISDVTYGHNKSLILGINFEGVQVLDQHQKTTKTYKHQPNNPASLSSNEISSLIEQGDSILWVGTSNKGLNKIDYKKNTVTRIPYEKNSPIPSSRINTLYTSKKGDLWIGSKDGVHVITTKGDTLSLKKQSTLKKGLSDDNILCFEEDNLGNIWIGTRNGGLNIINTSNFLSQKEDVTIKHYLPREDGLSVFNRTVSSLKRDTDGNMWIGTSTGLNFVNPNGEPVRLLQRNIAQTETLGHDRIGALLETKNGQILVGTDGAGLDIYDPKTGGFKHFLHKQNNPNSLSNNYVISLYEDTKNRLWVGNYQGGLNQMNLDTGFCKHYLQGDIEQGSDVRIIFEDSKNTIWIGTNRGGLFKYIENQDRFEYINSLGKLDIRDISEDKDNNLWMATYGNGILKYKPINDTAVFYSTSNTIGLKSDILFSILVLPNESILAGTRHEGLLKFAPKNKTLKYFTESDGLSNNTVNSIIMENENSFWFGTDKGISHYNSKTEKLFNLNNYNNVQQSEFSIGAALISQTGSLYFGGGKGLNIFNPKKINTIKEIYPIIFENLEVFNKKVPIIENKEDGVLNQSISYQNHITLNHDQTLISIDYAALKYPFIKNTNYSYRLDDYHKHWVNTHKNGTVNLTNIPFGDYTLKVKADFGLEDEVIKALKITINPPFWKTPLAYLGYFIAIVIALWSIMKYYSKHIKLINSLHFEKKQRQLEYDFNEERMRFFTSFSHELKTPLTLIIAPLEDLILELKTKKLQNKVQLINKNAKLLMQSIHKLLEFRKSNLGLSKLIVEKHNLSFYLNQWVQNYHPLAKKRKISLTFSQPEEALMAWFDLEKLHIIINNLLSNAFKHCEEQGKIHISLNSDKDYFTISVEDNGSGIRENELEHIFDWYYQAGTKINKGGAGIGLALSKKFTELHKGHINVESQYKKGSIFTVNFPKNKTLFLDNISEKEIESNSHTTYIPEINLLKNIPSNIHPKDDRETILLVDDNSDILEYLDSLLENQYDLIYAKDGQEGIEKATKYIPDLIISDIMMPKINGLDLCNTLKQKMETTHIPIILLTAKDTIDSIKTGYEEGADDYITKPFKSELLKSRVKNLLSNRKQLRNYFLKKEKISPSILKEKTKLIDREKDFLKLLEGVILKDLQGENTTVETISKNMGMSRTSLFRKTKAITGLNINQFINRVKINLAAELIRDKNFTISQASYEVGFNNVKYFRKLFKEQFGHNPSDLLKKSK